MTRPRGTVTLGSERRAASGPSAYRRDLSEGLCVGVSDFTERPQALQYVVCIQCPVADLCPARTVRPEGVCCRRGHMLTPPNLGPSGRCLTCERDRRGGTRTPPNVTLEALAEATLSHDEGGRR